MLTDISKGWKYSESIEGDENLIPADASDIDLPADLLRRHNRNYKTAMGAYGSYYDGVAAEFFRPLPRFEKCERIVLEIEGVCQFADVVLGGVTVAHIEGDGKHFVDISRHYVFGGKNVLRLKVWAPQMAGRYVGAGISGGVRVHTHAASLSVKEDGVYVISSFSGGKAHLGVRSELCDSTGEYSSARRRVTVEATLYNARGKKVARKIKKIKLKNKHINICDVNFKLSRYYTWSVADPYLYTATVAIKDEDGRELDSASSEFGITDRYISPTRGLVINGTSTKLKGAVVAADNGILGAESELLGEEYKLSRIKEIGYNAVRYATVPTSAALSALDRVGLYAEVDIFGVWGQGNYPYDGHVGFAERAAYDCERIVCELRKHPSVVLYGLDADAEETYERGDGSAAASMLASIVRMLDPSRPISVNARERVPLESELEKAGIKNANHGDPSAALKTARQKDLFGTLTANSFAVADVAGYSYLYPRYSSDKGQFRDRMIIGAAEYPARAFEAFEECDKSSNVIGEFNYCAADYLGYPLGKPEYEEEQPKLLPPHASYCGDLDLIYNPKPAACYRSIMLGNRSVSCITVTTPESVQNMSSPHAVKETHAVWNWPHYLGKTVEIEVFSGGEVVALYRDGKLIGRKLAGKINKHIATFRTEFYPGKLEAVSYHKGRECSRTTLESVTSPRAVKLSAVRKSARDGELMFVEVKIADKEGRVVPYASREVEINVIGAGELYAFGSADPEAQTHTADNNICGVYNGKALAVIRAKKDGDGKICVKAFSDGLLAGKINLRVKD